MLILMGETAFLTVSRLYLPGTLTQAIRNFAKSLEGWLTNAMRDFPQQAIQTKVAAPSAAKRAAGRGPCPLPRGQQAAPVPPGPPVLPGSPEDAGQEGRH